MLMRLFIALVALVAVLAGIFAIVLPRDALAHLVMFRDFFDMALPILAFGALIKYLCSCCPAAPKCCCCGKECKK